MESFFQFSNLFAGNIFLYIFALFFSISFVVFVHELGHYTAARLFGVRIDKFSIGFGHEVKGYTDKRGTRWSLSLLPLGGYVKIFGDVNKDDPKIWDAEKEKIRKLTKTEMEVAFCTKPLWQRAVIIASGPAINFLFTFLVLVVLFSTIGQTSTRPVITAIGIGTAGHEAGFELMDEITAINDRQVNRFEDVWEYTLHQPGRYFTFTLLRNGETKTITAASRPVAYKDKRGLKRAHGRMGITHIAAVKLEDILAVNGVDTGKNPDRARRELLKNMDKQIKVTLDSGKNNAWEFLIRPAAALNEALKDPASEDYDKLYTGITKDEFMFNHNLLQAIYYAGVQVIDFGKEALKVLELVLTGGGGQNSVGGVGTLGKATGKAVDSGWYAFFIFLAVLSFQIAFINLLPIPLLDGGYLIFLAYEAVRGRPLPQRVQDYAFSLGLAFLVGIMIFANLSDIFQFTRQ